MTALSKLLGILGLAVWLAQAVSPENSTVWPVHNDGYTKLVEWDHYSFLVNGERIFVFSGEFHYWRYPVPELWRDLLEKIKAAGFNAFSIYNHWGWHNPSPGVLDFENGAHNFTAIMELAKELGMYMIIRPGPYVNAEANAGGFPLWVTTGAYGSLRNNDSRYTEAWTPYMEKVSKTVEPYLITNGGNVILFQIENEFGDQWKSVSKKTPDLSAEEYMAALEQTARGAGIDVPLTYNAPNMNTYSWSNDFAPNATGNVDVVGLDSYPSCWSCNLSECTSTNGEYAAYKTANYYDYFTADSPTMPHFMPEFQGGSYNPWGGPVGGCPTDTGADFANMFYRNLIYQRVTAISLYMLFGGTSWGWHAAPVVATSYDYSSPVSEDRSIGSKYYETKLLTQFTRVARDLAHTDRLGNSTNYTSNSVIAAAELRNPDTGAAFYVTMHSDSTSSSSDTFSLHVNTSEGSLTIPQHGISITLNGHQAKIIPTDFAYGSKTLLYSTAEVLTYSIVNGKEILALWLPTGESGEFSIKGVTSAKLVSNSRTANFKTSSTKASVTVSFTQNAGMSIVELSDGSRAVLLDRSAAYLFWSPALDNNPRALGNDTLLVQGPYLVRSATVQGSRLELTGDLANSTTISVFAPKAVKTVTWNGQKLSVRSSNGDVLTGSLEKKASFTLPTLTGWKYTDSLPEVKSGYLPSSAAWVSATNQSTSNPTEPALNNPVLWVDDYKIHVGTHIFRATFSSTSNPPTGVYLNVTGGTAFGYSAWLNSKYIGSYLGTSYTESASTTFSFANATLTKKGDNVLVLVMDNSGHDETSGALNPRGIYNATLLGPSTNYSFGSWKIAGTAGRESYIDPIRGPLNEGGLYAERVGMHLPGYTEGSNWSSLSSGSNLIVPGAGIRVYRTVIPLHVPSGLDVSISFHLIAPSNSTFTSSEGATNQLRALLFVNGYQYGRFNPYIGNQVDFPIPPGILNYDGDNTIAVTIWSQSAGGAEVKIGWQTEYVHESSYDMNFDGGYLRPGWTKSRLQYA